MTQFINFIKYNDYIPARSVLLISDDRHHEEYFTDHFLPQYQEYGWKVVNAWISADGTTQDLWDENARVEAAGYVDHQAHGVVHNENMSDSSTDEYITSELQGSIDRIQEHFGKVPKAIIWPGGTFGYRPIEIAKELGYEVGFTVSPRGPVMYNWIPLDDETDAGRPSYLADGTYDPLFVLPRYWDTDVSQHIDTVRQIGKAAKEEINSNREAELEYYDIMCKPVTGEIPGL
jgi:peptidoglycan/xylan/chitin deacetylase (PgdA/CDA1 family)